MLFGDSMSAGYVSWPWNRSAQTVRIAYTFYRSCRKATLWFEILACNSASLPFVPQRASCIVGPLQYYRAHCFFWFLQEDLRRVISAFVYSNSQNLYQFLALRRSFHVSSLWLPKMTKYPLLSKGASCQDGACKLGPITCYLASS